MVPFLHNANELRVLSFSSNNLQSGGFKVLLRALQNSPIEVLRVNRSGIESIEIDGEHIPKHLKSLYLNGNIINADGCRGLTKLLLESSHAAAKDIELYKSKLQLFTLSSILVLMYALI